MPTVRRRRYHQRSHNGCMACKRRHARCDEARPYCRSCLVLGSECHYPSKSVAGPVERQNSVENHQLGQYEDLWSQEPVHTMPHTVGPTNSDPFASLEINMPFNSTMLLHHFNTYRILVKTPVTKQPGGTMLDFVLSDPALLHGAIMLAANHWVMLGGIWAQIAAAFYYHKVETIRLVNERLVDMDRATTEGTIGAIAQLVLAESSLGFVDAAMCHMKGLEHLVKARGDFVNSEMSPLLHRMVMLADLRVSSATKTLAKFSAMKEKPESSSDAHVIAQQASSSSSQIDHIFVYQDLDRVKGLNVRTKKMLVLLRRLSENTPRQAQSVSLSSELIREVEHLIDLILHEPESADPVPMDITLANGCVSIAGYIYLHLFIKRVPLRNPIYEWHLHLLKEALQQLQLSRPSFCIERCWPELWGWVLFVGGCATVRRDDRTLICTALANSKRVCGLGGWDEAKSMLERLIWTEEDNGLGLELWTEVCQVATSSV